MASIRKHREKWQAQIRIKGWKPIAKSFRHKSDAVAWATIIESEMRRETFVDPRQASATTLAEAIDRYIAEYDNPDSTRVSRCKRLSQHLGDFSLSNLSSKQLAEYRNKRLKLAAPMTVIHELNQLNRILVIATTGGESLCQTASRKCSYRNVHKVDPDDYLWRSKTDFKLC